MTSLVFGNFYYDYNTFRFGLGLGLGLRLGLVFYALFQNVNANICNVDKDEKKFFVATTHVHPEICPRSWALAKI